MHFPGFVTDTINRQWLHRLKKLELDDILLRRDDGTRVFRQSLSARANSLPNLRVP